jgi:hypothetical protein
MKVVNTRNALVGWATIKIARRVLAGKQRSTAATRAARGAVAAGLVTAGGALVVLKKRRRGGTEE